MKKWPIAIMVLLYWNLVWAQPACPPEPLVGIENEQTEGFPEKLATPEQRAAVVNLTLFHLESDYFNGFIPKRDWSRFTGKAFSASNERAFYDALREWLGEFRQIDGQSAFFSARQGAALDRAEIGLVLGGSREAGNGFVMGVIPGSPAERAGIRPRDRILAVDGKGCWNLGMTRGEAGTQVMLTIQTANQAPRDLKLTREPRINTAIPPVASRLVPDPKIGYFWINRVVPDLEQAKQIRAALEELASGSALEGLILDLRGSRIYYLAIETLVAPFVSGVVFKIFDSYGSSLSFIVSPSKPSWYNLPLVVLLDSTTAENSIWVAGILQRRPKTLLIGRPTPPMTLDWNTADLPDGSCVQFSTLRFGFPDGSGLVGGRVIPSIMVSENWLDYPQADDPYIKAALEALKKLR